MEESSGENIVRVEVIAQLFDVTVRRVQQLTQEGVISTVSVKEGNRSVRRYDLIPTIQAYIKYLSERAYGKQHRTDEEIKLREQKMRADIALKESQGELHRLKTEIAAGQYISKEEVTLDYAKFFVSFKKFATSIPVRLTSLLAGQMDPVQLRKAEKEIAGEVKRLLSAFVIAGVVGPKDVPAVRKRQKAEKDKVQEIRADRLPGGGASTAEAGGGSDSFGMGREVQDAGSADVGTAGSLEK